MNECTVYIQYVWIYVCMYVCGSKNYKECKNIIVIYDDDDLFYNVGKCITGPDLDFVPVYMEYRTRD